MPTRLQGSLEWASGELLVELQGSVQDFSPDSKSIVTAGSDGTARVHRILTLKEVGRILGPE